MTGKETKKKEIIYNVLNQTVGDIHTKILINLDEPMYDEDIARNLNIKITIIRKLLNELHEQNLVSYERFKNKNTGWYTYKWRRRDRKINAFVADYLENQLHAIEIAIEYEKENPMFYCPECNNTLESDGHMSLSEAMDLMFECSKCKHRLVEYDNSSRILQLEQSLNEIRMLSGVPSKNHRVEDE